MIVGFTGTQKGMTTPQMHAVARLLVELKPEVVHHGGCIGADMNFDALCEGYGIRRICRPGDNVEKHGASLRDFTYTGTLLSPKPNLERNRIIVRVADELIATPQKFIHLKCRHGTCATARYAKKCLADPSFKLQMVHIVLPDGRVEGGARSFL